MAKPRTAAQISSSRATAAADQKRRAAIKAAPGYRTADQKLVATSNARAAVADRALKQGKLATDSTTTSTMKANAVMQKQSAAAAQTMKATMKSVPDAAGILSRAQAANPKKVITPSAIAKTAANNAKRVAAKTG